MIGLTAPTWAPVLTYNLTSKQFTYRQSRIGNCKNAAGPQTAQLTVDEHPIPVRVHRHAGRVQRDRGRQHAVPQELRALSSRLGPGASRPPG